MKKIIFAITACMITCGLFATSSHGYISENSNDAAGDTAMADSAVSFVAYFAKGDTCDYRITESKWNVNGADTTMLTCITTKVRLIVTDSTSAGYRMSYTFTDMENDTIANSYANNLLNRVTDKLRENVVGTTIVFDTDETGAITKVHNLAEIKKKAKTLYKEGMKEIIETPEIKALKENGFDLAKLAKGVDTDELLESYLDELNLLFMCHGKSYPIGETHEHEDATKDDLESDTYTTVYSDNDNNMFGLDIEVVSVLPQSDMKELLGGIASGLTKDTKMTDELSKEFDSQIKEDGSISERYAIDCFINGWPSQVVKQRTVKMGSTQRLNQTYIGVCHFGYKEE